MQGIGLESDNLTGWDFSGQNLSNARFSSGTLTSANLSNATIAGADFGATNVTANQLYGTVDYHAKTCKALDWRATT